MQPKRYDSTAQTRRRKLQTEMDLLHMKNMGLPELRPGKLGGRGD
jgi:hypothetical protein